MATDPLIVKSFLVIRATGEMRIVRGARGLRLSLDEIAFPITVSIPRQWGRVQMTTIELVMPEPPEAWVQVGEAEGVAVEEAKGGN